MIRQTLAANVKGLRDYWFSQIRSETARNKAVARLARTSLSQLQRITKAEKDIGIDRLEPLAMALKCAPHELLTPYFSNTVAIRSRGRGDPGDEEYLHAS